MGLSSFQDDINFSNKAVFQLLVLLNSFLPRAPTGFAVPLSLGGASDILRFDTTNLLT